MTGRTALEEAVTLTREDAWHRVPRQRLQELAREVQALQAQVQRANVAVGQAAAGGNLRVLRSTLKHLEGRLLERRRYVVTFRRHHRM